MSPTHIYSLPIPALLHTHHSVLLCTHHSALLPTHPHVLCVSQVPDESWSTHQWGRGCRSRRRCARSCTLVPVPASPAPPSPAGTPAQSASVLIFRAIYVYAHMKRERDRDRKMDGDREREREREREVMYSSTRACCACPLISRWNSRAVCQCAEHLQGYLA